MDVFVDHRVEEVLRRDFFYCFTDDKYPGIPELKLHRFDNQNFVFKEREIIPILTKHYKLPVFGFRLGDFSYITDANFIAEEERKKIRGSKVVVLNALRKSSHISHFTLEEAIAVAQDLGAEQTYLTHMSHQIGLHAEVSKELPDGVALAYDGLVVEI